MPIFRKTTEAQMNLKKQIIEYKQLVTTAHETLFFMSIA